MRHQANKILLTGVLLALSVGGTRAEWTAFFDYARGTGTAATNVLSFGADGNNNTGGYLTNQFTGARLPETLTMASAGAAGGANTVEALATATYAYNVFNGFCDLSGNCSAYMDADTKTCSILISNLNPNAKYSIIGTVNRNNSAYTVRITKVELLGANAYTPVHTVGVLTNGLPANQAGFVCYNQTGDYVSWTNIDPGPDGAIEIKSSRFTNQVAYALSAFKIQELSEPVAIVTQPIDTRGCLNGSATFTVDLSGTAPFWFQWYKGTNTVSVTNRLTSATNQTLLLTNLGSSDAGYYRVVVSNAVNAVTSLVAQLTVDNHAITITTQPADASRALGGSAVFNVGVSTDSSTPISYQWYFNSLSNSVTGSKVGGSFATTAHLIIGSLALTNAGYYYCVLSNCIGYATSRVAQLSIFVDPVQITAQPQDVTVFQGSSANFSVTASGSKPSYQWYKGSAVLTNATNATLTLNNVQYQDSGYYHVVVTNLVSSVTSSNGLLVVSQPPYDIMGWTNWVWKYNQLFVDLGTAWKEVGYNDSSWPSGVGVFGFNQKDATVRTFQNTTLTGTNAANQAILCYYFRTTFVLTNDPASLTLVASNLWDDGFVVYVNGTEAYRINMPNGAIAYNTVTPAATDATFGNVVVTNIPSSLLVQGTNTLAVECHQVNATSSDLTMGLAIRANFPTPTFIQITNQPASLTVEEAKPATFTVGYIGVPAYFQWYKWTNNTAQLIPGATSQSYTVLNPVAGQDDGYYFVTVSNFISMSVSSNAFLTVLVDTNAPYILDADGSTSSNTIILTFSEALMLYNSNRPWASPTNIASYTVTNTFGDVARNMTVTSAVFTNGTNVILTTSAGRPAGVNYVVTIGTNGVFDISPRHNLATNIAAPVSILTTLVNWVDAYDYDQPLMFFGSETSYYTDRTWLTPGFNPYSPLYPSSTWGGPNSSGFANTYGVVDAPIPMNSALIETDGYLTTYFRKKFTYTASSNLRLRLRHFVQSGAVFYLNGYEVHRFNMPAGTPTIMTPAATQITAGTISTNIDLPAFAIVGGDNVLAVELHFRSMTDIYTAFAAELIGKIDGLVLGNAIITRQPTNVTVYEGQPAIFNFVGMGGASFQWRTNSGTGTPVNLPNGTNIAYVIPSVTRAMDGLVFSVVETGVSNSVTSSNAILRVLADTNPPVLISAYLTDTNVITVSFSEAVTLTTATNLANYAVTNAIGANLTITSITLTNGSNVLIKVSSFTPGQYTLVASMIRDISTAGNYLATNSRATVGLADWPLVTFDTNSIWKYNQNNVDLGTSFTSRTYNDSTWEVGPSVLDGKIDGNGLLTPRTQIGGLTVGTVLSNIVLRDGQYVGTYYFRKWVNVPLMGPGATMTLSHLLDDGAAFYMNGQLFYAIRVNTPTTFGATGTGNAVGDAALEGPFFVPVTNLVAGSNMLSSDLHQTGAASTDATFGTELRLTVPSLVLTPGGAVAPTAVPLYIARQGTNVVLSWSNTAPWVLQYKAVLHPATNWVQVPNQANPYTMPATNKYYYYRLDLQ
jgi:hypothetical protein